MVASVVRTPRAASRRPAGAGEVAVDSSAPRGGRLPLSDGQRQALAALAFLAPGLLALVMLRLLPAASAITDSFQSGSFSASPGSWVGLENYRFLFASPDFWNTVRVTLEFAVIINPLQILVALALALLLVGGVRGSSVVRTLLFLPIAVPGAVATVVWGTAFQPEGPINAALNKIGISDQPFLTSPDQALWSIVILLSWAGVGFWTIFLLAGLHDIPRSLYEAAAIDGAGYWRTLWHITLPNMRRPLAFVLVAATVANFLVFVPVQILTDGGPSGSTRLIMYDLYNQAFLIGDINLAQAEVVLVLIVMLVITSIQFRLLTPRR